MTTPIIILTILSIVAVCLLLWMYRRLAMPRDWHADLGAWWLEFRPERYQPMARLLRREDEQYVRSLPGYRPGMESRLRRQRIASFQAYLREIRRDYNRLHVLGSDIAAATISASLHNELFRQRVRFTRALWRVQFDLAIYRMGIGTVDPSALVDSLRATTRIYEPALSAALA